MAVGDICFFCTTRCIGPKKDWINKYHWVARVIGTLDIAYAADVSKAFWDTDDFYPYLLGKPFSIEVGFEEFGFEIDPSGKFYKKSPQCSTRLTDRKKLKHVLDKHGSVDNWAEHYIEQLTLEPLPPAPAAVSPNAPPQHKITNEPYLKASYKERLPAIREWLIKVAKAKMRVTYKDFRDAFGIDRLTSNHSMDRLGEQSLRLGEPILTALIVGRKNSHSSIGVNKFGVVDDEAERQKLYAYWADNDPVVLQTSTSDSLEVQAAKFASVEVRPDQAAFRRKVFTAYGGCCAISGCSVERALDAAHRHGSNWRMGHNRARDGILLRKDLHALYDSNLLTISPEGLVEMSEEIIEHYEMFIGATLRTTIE
ncbi:hypothetical protein BOO88_10560 [Stutzerimonas stutzeri]|nr:hypothetical protein BOO89_08325 [Stutzerimonas stutzeri]AZO89345.1 hypothetical protein BOO88_10560 [Stutzerimonas stutzeri]